MMRPSARVPAPQAAWHFASKWARTAFILTCLLSLLFAAAMISEVMAKNYLAAAKGAKARMPVAQAIMLFLGLGQIPLRLFTRRPELLD